MEEKAVAWFGVFDEIVDTEKLMGDRYGTMSEKARR